MFARLWWKEARQTWPVWAFLACVGVALQGLIRVLAGPGADEGVVVTAGLATVIYLFLIAAAAFAGERESGTLGLLDALPVDRVRLWGAKASFALVTTMALGMLLWSSSVAFVGVPPSLGTATAAGLVWAVVALGWGLFWSSLLGNALHAAVLAMASLGATLTLMVNLQNGPTAEAAPALLLVGLVAAGGSAVAFIRGGPPRWERRRDRPAPKGVESVAAAPARRIRAWPASVGRLVWETWRQIRSELRFLLTAAVVALYLYHASEWSRVSSGGAEILMLAMAALGLMAGVATFNAENRGRTNRFLHQHGVRPGVAWGVKVLMWGATAVALGILVQAPNILAISRAGSLPGAHARGVPGLVVAAIVGILTIPFAVGALCGMVFRRGILAGSVAVVVSIVLAIFLGAAAALEILDPASIAWIALAFLAVTWAWSGDWLHHPPGFGKWARLALWCGLATAVVVPRYIAERAWVSPSLTEEESRTLFQSDRFLRPVPPEEDAAPRYREVDRLVNAQGGPVLADGIRPRWPFDVRDPVSAAAVPVTDPGVLAWLEKLEPALAIARDAARLPACRYEDVRKSNIFTWADEPPLMNLATPLALSAQAKLARGDLDGSWKEVETLLRMARQYSTVRGMTYASLEGLAVHLAMKWAADPKQTADSLERALTAFRELPPSATPADRTRIERIAFQNTTYLPREELVAEYLRSRGHGSKYKPTTWDALSTSLLTTPWELSRARQAYDLLAAAWIQRMAKSPYLEVPPATGPNDATPWMLYRPETYRPPLFQKLIETTPMIRLDEPGVDAAWYPRIEADRRALGLILQLRLHQARHDGALPRSLAELAAWQGETSPAATVDPYSGKPFGYIPSSGQPLLAPADALFTGTVRPRDDLLKSSEGCWLLYSIGPDRHDDRGFDFVDYQWQGDLVYPIKDGVKPPAASAP